MDHGTPRKRRKRDNDADVSSVKQGPATVDEIRGASQDGDGFDDALKRTRNFLTVRTNEGAIPANDPRVVFVKEWVESSPGLTELFGLLDKGVKPSTTVLALAIIGHQLNLLSAHFIYHTLGQPIVKKLLSHMWLRRLESYLSGSHTDLTLSTLKLLLAMSNFAGSKEQKTFLDAFTWDAKVFVKLLFMQRHDNSKATRKQEKVVDPMERPDIRTLCLMFILSFVSAQASHHVKSVFLEQHREVVQVVFKRVHTLPYVVVKHILETLWTDLWQDRKVKRSLKVSVFNEGSISSLLKLYELDSEEDGDPENIPANLVHHFLLAICTHRGVGICFPDNGWYPRPSDDDNDANGNTDRYKDPNAPMANGRNRFLSELLRGGGGGNRVYNKILANVLKSLKVNEDARQQELALKILDACPELVAGYFPSAGITLEPRLSSKWLANIAFFGSVISLPVPSRSFLLPLSAAATSTSSPQYNPTPPPLVTILENTLPSLGLKVHFSKGLQAVSPLVQHSTALALVKCLMKFESVREEFKKVAKALGEGEGGREGGENGVGLWTKRWEEVETEARKRVPDIQVVIAFSQQKHIYSKASGDGVGVSERSVKVAMLSEVAKRLLWLYHRCFPGTASEARFDAGRLLVDVVGVRGLGVGGDGVEDEGKDGVEGFERLKQLHVLRILEESGQLNWSGKVGTASKSIFCALVSIYLSFTYPTIQSTLTSVLLRTFSETLLFQHDPLELKLWLEALPRSVRAKGAKSLEGTALTDEGEGVVDFLDDCLQRCAKATHRYIEEMDSLATPEDSGSNESGIVNASPLLMTVLEQLTAKLRAKLLNASDQLAVVTYIRVLVSSLIGKQNSGTLGFFVKFAEKVDEVVRRAGDDIREVDKGLARALVRQSRLLKAVCLSCEQPDYVYDVTAVAETGMSGAVESFLAGVENVLLSENARERRISAYELVDWVRFVNPVMSSEQLLRLSNAIFRLHPSAVRDLYLNVDPACEEFWEWLGGEPSGRQERMPLDHLTLLVIDPSSSRSRCRDTLTMAIRAQRPDIRTLKCICGILLHRIAAHNSDSGIVLVQLLADVVEAALPALEIDSRRTLKVFLFGESYVLKSTLCNVDMPPNGTAAVSRLIKMLLDVHINTDLDLVTSVCSFWAAEIRRNVTGRSLDSRTLHNSLPWIRYMSQEEVTATFSEILNATTTTHFEVSDTAQNADFRSLVEEMLSVLSSKGSPAWLQIHLIGLISLRGRFSNMPHLDELIAEAIHASLPLGIDGFGPGSSMTLSLVLAEAESRLSLRKSKLPEEVRINTFLNSGPWTRPTSRIVTGMVYRSANARRAYHEWLLADKSALVPVTLLVPSFNAFLETSRELYANVDVDNEPVKKTYKRLWSRFTHSLSKPNHQKRTRRRLASCMVTFFERFDALRSEFAKSFSAKVQKMPLETVIPELLEVALSLTRIDTGKGKKMGYAVVNQVLQWAARFLSGASELGEESKTALACLCPLVATLKQITPSFAEPTIVAALESNSLLDSDVLLALEALFANTPLKPVNVNRYLQNILQHRQVERFTLSQDSDNGVHASLAKLLYTIFHLHPTNTCQPSHLQPLIRLYGGSLSKGDCHLLEIFRLYETQRQISVASLIANWSAPGNEAPQSSLDALSYLEPSQILRTCMNFPIDRPFDGSPSTNNAQIYDPAFVVLLFAQVLSTCPPSTALNWVQMFRTNVVSLVIRCLSAKDASLRSLALVQLGALYKLVEIADMHEKPHVMHLLGLLRDTLKAPQSNPAPRLPSYMTLMLAHAMRGIFYPSNFMYPQTARFLLQRPELDLHDIPLLYTCLYSHEDNWKKERGWILKFVADGLASSSDWQAFKRRHTWELMATLYQGSRDDRPLRHGILQVLVSITRIQPAITSMILRYSLLPWVELQIQHISGDECLPWVKIIENISLVVDSEKMERSTRGEWRSCLLRCLASLPRPSSPSSIHISARTCYRLLAISADGTLTAIRAITTIFGRMLEWEHADGPRNSPMTHVPVEDTVAHGAYDLFQDRECDRTLLWGQTVEYLWKASMICNIDTATWDKLTCRLLVWRTLACSGIAEWIRTEIVELVSSLD